MCGTLTLKLLSVSSHYRLSPSWLLVDPKLTSVSEQGLSPAIARHKGTGVAAPLGCTHPVRRLGVYSYTLLLQQPAIAHQRLDAGRDDAAAVLRLPAASAAAATAERCRAMHRALDAPAQARRHMSSVTDTVLLLLSALK